ncbi:MAG: PGPGW domain-containing protein [Thermoleophilia bacterium]
MNTETSPERSPRRPAPARDDALGEPADVPRRSRRGRIRSTPGLAQGYRVGVFVAGLLCIGLGLALAVLPGPLTIPPVLLGLWIWSTEFRFAERFLEAFRRKANDAWAHARRHPHSSAAVTLGGLVAAVVATWAITHLGLIGEARQAVGL